MGRMRRDKPLRLSHKLLAIRKRLQMSQTEMARALELKVHYSAVSNFELGTREPDLIIVLRYARLAGVPMEMIVDDQVALDVGVLPVSPECQPKPVPAHSGKMRHVFVDQALAILRQVSCGAVVR